MVYFNFGDKGQYSINIDQIEYVEIKTTFYGLELGLKSGQRITQSFKNIEDCKIAHAKVVNELNKFSSDFILSAEPIKNLYQEALMLAIKRFDKSVKDCQSITPNQASLALLAIDSILHPGKG